MRFLTIQNKQFRMAVSKLVLGTNYFGTTISEEESFRLMDYYFSHGGNILDTARSYANWLPGGESASERTIA